jgi:hypothetical protein
MTGLPRGQVTSGREIARLILPIIQQIKAGQSAIL